MFNFLKNNHSFNVKVLSFAHKKTAILTALLLLALPIPAFFYDVQLALAFYSAIALLIFLSAITLIVLLYMGVNDKETFQLFFITFFVHLFFALLLYYIIYHTPFRPLGGGSDFDLYQNNALVFADRLKSGIFSTKGLFTDHYFGIIIGIIYFLTAIHPVVGQLLTVWCAVLSAILMYTLMLEIGSSKKQAFFVALLLSAYPSYLFFGSVLLKEIFVIPLVLAGLLVSVQIFKKFSAIKFLTFFFIVSGVIHFRFYIGLALLFTFIISWFLISNSKKEDKVILGLAIVFILGFSPYIMGHGFLGEISINRYLVPKQIKDFREVTYAPISEELDQLPLPSEPVSLPDEPMPSPNEPIPSLNEPVPSLDSEDRLSTEVDFFKERVKSNKELTTLEGRPLTQQEIIKNSGTNSSFTVKSGVENPLTFITNSALSFIYALLGPFPWQIKLKRQLISFAEVIPWWLFFSIIVYGVYSTLRHYGVVGLWNKYRYAFPLALFSILAIAAISLFINNFGIITRIRMPAVISFLCILALGPNLMPMWEKWSRGFFRSKSSAI